MIGKLLLQTRQRLQHGPRVAWYRDHVRPRILATPPVTGTTDFTCELHVFTSESDWLNLVWALKSFYHFSRKSWALAIHLDGTLTAVSEAHLRHHFPAARLLSKAQADAEVLPTLAAFPRCADFRRTNHLSPKVFDFLYYLRSDRMLLLDSDILFFAPPTALLARIEDPSYQRNTLNADLSSAYTVDPNVVQQTFGFSLQPRINSGLGLIHRSSFSLPQLEEYLALPDVLSHFWRIEQTLYAIFSSRHGVDLLPPEYDVRLGIETPSGPVRHYVGQIRHLMYSEGIRHLARHSSLLRRA